MPLDTFARRELNMARRHVMASFPRLNAIRNELGWEVTDIHRRLADGRPSLTSLYRVDGGDSIRLISVRKIFNIIRAEMEARNMPGIEADEEIKIEA